MMKKVERRKLLDNEPTNCQAEVLVYDWIRPEDLVKAIFMSEELLKKYSSDIPDGKAKVNSGINLFAPRHDW